MKIRTGFVSNSSSASFVVKIKKETFLELEKDKNFLINEKDISKLKEYGFVESNLFSPFINKEPLGSAEHYVSMKYFTSCNFEEVICFLVKNNIPFKAACHYDNKYVSYKKDSDYVFEAINYGITMDMYGEDIYDSVHTDNLFPFKKILKEEYLEIYDNNE